MIAGRERRAIQRGQTFSGPLEACLSPQELRPLGAGGPEQGLIELITHEHGVPPGAGHRLDGAGRAEQVVSGPEQVAAEIQGIVPGLDPRT